MTLAVKELSKSVVRSMDRTTPSRRHRLPGLMAAPLLTLLAGPAMATTVYYYSGTDSAGYEVDIYTTPNGQGTAIYNMGLTGNRYCNRILVPGAILGGNTDGNQLHQIIDGHVTFSELRPDYFISADLHVSDKKIKGSATFKQAIYTGSDFPPKDRDSAACTTKKLTFTAAYVTSYTFARHEDAPPMVRPTK